MMGILKRFCGSNNSTGHAAFNEPCGTMETKQQGQPVPRSAFNKKIFLKSVTVAV